MEIVCSECGKRRDVLYPDLWQYKCNKRYYCSYKCFRKGEVKMGNVTWEMKEKAVKIALAGGDVLAYLEECGSKNPQSMWWTIKNKLKETDPEAYKKLPDLRPGANKPVVDKGMPVKPEATVKVDGPIRIETPEANLVQVAEVPKKPKINQPLMHSGKKAVGWEGDFGVYIYDRKHGYIDYESNDGEEISMPVDAWREWLKEIVEIAQLMGVEL